MAIKNFGTSTMRVKEGIYITGSVEQTGGSTLQDFSLINSGSIYNQGNIFIDGKESASDETYIQFMEAGDDRSKIGINTSNNLVLHNQYINKHIVFKVNDQGNTREGLRIDGAVPEVVVNEGSDSLVDFRVESDNNTHMIFVDGSEDKVGIGISQPATALHAYADASNAYVATIDNDAGSNAHGLKVTTDGTGTGTTILDIEAGSTTVFKVRGDGRVGIGVDTPGSTLSVDDEIAVGEKLIHRGDPDTYLQFPAVDQMILAAGGMEMIRMVEDGSNSEITFNDGASANLDFVIKGDTNNPLFHTDAANNRIGIGGIGSPAQTLDVNGTVTISVPGTETKISLKGNTTTTAILEDASFAGLGSSNFSVSFWWYANDTNSDPINSNSRIIFYGGSSEHHSIGLKTPDVKITYENSAGSNDFAEYDTNHVEQGWYHIVAYFDVSNLGSGTPRLWQNGVEINGTGYSAVAGSTPVIDKVKVYLDDGAAIQDLVFWNKLLTTQEIAEIYNDGYYVNPSITSMAGSIVSWFKLGYEDLWAAAGFSAGDSISGTVDIPDNNSVNEFTMTSESEFSLMNRTINKRSKSDFKMDSTSLQGLVVVEGSMEVIDKTDLKGAVHYNIRDINSTSVVRTGDYVLRCIQTGAITLTLPPKNESRGRVLIIKDTTGNLSNPNNYTITLDGSGGETIDGSATFVMSHNKQSITLACDGINGWMIVSEYRP
jgi:hypothetical protein